MEEFLKRIPGKIACHLTIYMTTFTVISLLKGTDTIPTIKLLQILFIAACLGRYTDAVDELLIKLQYAKRY